MVSEEPDWHCVGVRLLSCRVNRGSAAEVTLPQGTAPAPIASGHFPDRVYEFVWRNWNVVEPAELAKILGTSVENVDALAASMGLPPATMIPPEMKTRGYITLIRRNWHLLPYDQLLELVGMTPERLDFVLREDDMLWYKLGLLKPKCAPLCYHPPDEAALCRAAEIRRAVEEEFGDEVRRPAAEPRFDFVRQLNRPCRCVTPQQLEETRTGPLRLVYSYAAVYGDPLLNPALESLSRGIARAPRCRGGQRCLAARRSARLGAGGATFPEFGTDHPPHLANLRVLVERAQEIRYWRVSVHERAAGNARLLLPEPTRDGRRPGRRAHSPLHVASGGAPMDGRRPCARVPPGT